MRIPLNKFEDRIDEVILERGRSYFYGGHVTDFAEISDGIYEANVSGTEEYTVRLELKDNVIVEHYCDCPYDFGPVCKHVAAAIFYLKQGDSNKQNGLTAKKADKKSSAVQMKKLLDKVSHENLKEFIQEYSRKDRRFKNVFISKFMYLDKGQSREFYQNQIQTVVKSAENRYGFIGWHEMKYLEESLQPIVSMGENHFEKENYTQAAYVFIALMEEMTAALQFCDDSSGFLGSIIESSYENLLEITSKDLPEDIRRELFDYCISAFENDVFEGWEWHIGILRIAFNLASNKKEANRIIKCLNRVDEWEERNAQALKLEIFSKYKSKKELKKFIDEHITNPLIRNSEIEKAIENKDFKRAIELAEDGIKYNQKNRQGLVVDWYDWLLKIARIQNDKTKIIEYARYLFIENFMPKEDYYEILKQNVDKEKWNAFLEEIIKEIKHKDDMGSYELIREIYIREKQWDRLLSMLKARSSLQSIESNEKYLSKDYAQELIQLYTERLLEFVEINTERRYYKTACRYLRRMKKLGGNEKVKELIEYFKKTYPRRKALLDELTRV